MGEELKEVKELRTEFVAYRGSLPSDKLFNKEILEALQKSFGEFMIPMIMFAYGEKKMVIVLYLNADDYKKGKATLAGDKPENVKEFYSAIGKILISKKE